MLDSFLTSNLFAFLMVFSRVGSGIMLLPGIGEVYVPVRVRLFLALGCTAAMTPFLAPHMPAPPSQPLVMAAYVIGEILIGLFLGGLARMLISAMHTAGTLIAMQSGLATAMMLDITQTSQSTALTNLLALTAVMLMFVTDLDHLLFTALAQSYDLFAPGRPPPVADMAAFLSQTLSRSFSIAMQLAAPYLVVSTLLNLGMGVLARLMPTMQIFFLLMGPQILISFALLTATLSTMMMWYLNYLQDTFGNFVHFSP